MAKCEKILAKAKSSPHNLMFAELCKLAECNGWIPHPQNGTSHAIYTNPAFGNTPGSLMNFQKAKDGKAKAYQVKQLLDAMEG